MQIWNTFKFQVGRDFRIEMGKESWLWKHFKKLDDKTAKCEICHKSLKYTGGSGALIYYTREVHKLSNPDISSTLTTKKRDASGRSVAVTTTVCEAPTTTKAPKSITSWFYPNRDCSVEFRETIQLF